MPEAPRRIIVNADDFGLSPAVNAAVEQAHRHGILTSATLLANAPHFEAAADLARANPGLGAGVHLNLVRGRPLSPPGEIPCLVGPDGRFRPFRFRFPTSAFLAQAEREYRRQFEKTLAAGIRPTHIDFEKHHAWQGKLYALACRLAREYGIRAARTLREPVAWTLRRMGWPGLRGAAMAVLLRSGIALAGAGRCEMSRPDWLLGGAHIGAMTEAVWVAMLGALPAGTFEVMTHPGIRDASGAGSEMGESWLGTAAREGELAALLSPAVRKCLLQAGFSAIHFGEL